VGAINDSSELHNRPLLIYVVCKPRRGGNGLQNEVKSYEALSAAQTAPVPAVPTSPVAPGTPAPSAPAPAIAAPGSVPWGRPASA